MRHLALAIIALGSCAITACGGRASSSAIPTAAHVPHNSTRRAQSSGSPYAALVALDDPIAYYPLDDTGTTMTDSGVNHLSGVYGANIEHAGPALTSNSGSQASIFGGAPAGSDIPSNSGTVGTSTLFASATAGLTIEAWIKPAALNLTNHYVPLVSYGREAAGQAWVLQLSPQSNLNFWMKVQGGAAPDYLVKSNLVLAPWQDYAVVASYDGANARIYVDGQLLATLPATGAIDYSGLLPQYGLGIGGGLGGAEPTFDGAISDVSIYPKALSASDILNHYTVGNPPPPTPAPSSTGYPSLVAASYPLAYYKLKDTAAVMADSGPNQLNGTYGPTVAHNGAPLTSALDASAILPGSPGGSNIPANTGTGSANALFSTAGTSLTVEAWVKMPAYNATNNYMPIVSYGRGGIGNVWALQVTPESSLDFYFKVIGGAGSYELQPGGAVLSPAQIYQVMATYNGTTANLYLDGTLVASVPATGALNYASTFPEYGLVVGGESDTTRPIFDGTINDVSIYPTALSPAAVESHFLSGHLVQALSETPANSDVFVDSIGVVTHLRSSGTNYTNSWPTFESLIEASGIRHIGDALISTPTWYPQNVNALAAAGIHASLITDLTQTAQDIAATLPSFQPALEAIEGPNEPDLSGDPNWVADTRTFQQMLWSLVKGNPATSSLSVVGPSVLSPADALALGNLSSYLDEGSIHDYFSGYNPGTAGWGSLDQFGIYGSISWNRNVGAVVSGTKPSISTETGYSSSLTNPGGVDSRTLARYIPRLYLEHFLNGIDRTTLYEFYDEPGIGEFNSFGLVGLNNAPKSSYYAVQSLIRLLADPGTVFSTTPLSYGLNGNIANVQHLLLQKRDGTHELVLWVETESFDPVAKTDITVPPQTVTLQPPTLPVTASLATIGDTGTVTSSALTFPNGIATFAIDDHVTVVSFK